MEILVGRVKHFYGHIPAMVVEVNEELKIGDSIVVKRKNGEEKFRQKVNSMEIEREKVEKVFPGQEVAILAQGKAKEGDLVYKEI